jgi:hypothetical protein
VNRTFTALKMVVPATKTDNKKIQSNNERKKEVKDVMATRDVLNCSPNPAPGSVSKGSSTSMDVLL